MTQLAAAKIKRPAFAERAHTELTHIRQIPFLAEQKIRAAAIAARDDPGKSRGYPR
jgi:hypothetical protein